MGSEMSGGTRILCVLITLMYTIEVLIALAAIATNVFISFRSNSPDIIPTQDANYRLTWAMICIAPTMALVFTCVTIYYIRESRRRVFLECNRLLNPHLAVASLSVMITFFMGLLVRVLVGPTSAFTVLPDGKLGVNLGGKFNLSDTCTYDTYGRFENGIPICHAIQYRADLIVANLAYWAWISLFNIWLLAHHASQVARRQRQNRAMDTLDSSSSSESPVFHNKEAPQIPLPAHVDEPKAVSPSEQPQPQPQVSTHPIQGQTAWGARRDSTNFLPSPYVSWSSHTCTINSNEVSPDRRDRRHHEFLR